MTSTTVDSLPTPHEAPLREAPPRPHRRTTGHVAAIVVGGLALIPGLAMVGGGGALAVGEAVATDDDGYFTLTLDPIEGEGVAIVSDDLLLDDIDEDGPWVADWLDLDLRLRVDGAGPTDEVFVGVARSSDVTAYLAGAPHTLVVEIDDRTAEYRSIAGEEGGASVGPPADEDFWVESASGRGEQELTWEARGGTWSIVVMNADGASDIISDVEIGARSGAITTIAVALLVAGGITVLVGVALIVIGVRGRRPADGPPVDGPSSDDPFAPPTPDAVIQADTNRATATLQGTVGFDDQPRQPTAVG